MDIITKKSSVSGIDAVNDLVNMFSEDELFRKGFGAGIEAETYPNRTPDPTGKDSPITIIAGMPAWEGSHRLRRREQDLRYSIGALAGAFATRAGLDTDEITDRMIGVDHE